VTGCRLLNVRGPYGASSLLLFSRDVYSRWATCGCELHAEQRQPVHVHEPQARKASLCFGRVTLPQDPYFNEPNVELMRGTSEGDITSMRCVGQQPSGQVVVVLLPAAGLLPGSCQRQQQRMRSLSLRCHRWDVQFPRGVCVCVRMSCCRCSLQVVLSCVHQNTIVNTLLCCSQVQL
jgi:hypothetical protein